MVFKKPYGFLIRHFKFIHLILTGLYIYLAIKVNSILTYYNRFIGGTASKLDAIHYVTNYYLIAITISLVICAIIYALMRYKKKPRFVYLLLILFYFVVLVVVQVVYGGLHTIYISILETKTLRLYRDLLQIMLVFQYLSIGMVLIRGLGFDIKKFNFASDLEELNIDVSDEEEVELTLGSTNSLQRKIRRRIREFKYYYFENKTFILIILLVLVVLLVGGIFVQKEVIAKEFQEGEVFSSDQYTFQVISTYVTNRDYNNRTITNTDTSFVVVKMNLTSNGESEVFNTSNLILKVNNQGYASNKKYASRFVDLGYSYQGQKVSGKNTYLFIFNVSNSDISSKMKLIYAGDKIVNLSPVFLDELGDATKYKLKDTVDLSKSSFGSGYFKIDSYEIQEKFSYPYEYEVQGNVYTSTLSIASSQNVIMNLKIDSSYPFNYDNYTFLSSYATLKYQIDGEEYTSYVFSDKTPGTYKEGLYVVVDKEVMNASNIWFDIKLRNSEYLYTLK